VVPGLGNVTATFAVAQPSSTQVLTLTITGLHLTTPTPAAVLLQARQSDNQEHGFSDEFAIQVVTTAKDRIVCRIRRLDANSGWGQKLRIDMLIVDAVVNP
jgi:hypothetical protein